MLRFRLASRFVPLLNFADTLDTKPIENGLVSDFIKGASGLFARLDGKELEHLKSDLVKTDFFSAGPTLPTSWAHDQGVQTGTELTPSKGAGFWIVRSKDCRRVVTPSNLVGIPHQRTQRSIPTISLI